MKNWHRIDADPRTQRLVPGCEDGAFKVMVKDGTFVKVIASNGMGWDHVSVSLMLQPVPGRSPTWDEMCEVKDIFFDAEELALQYHPPKSMYVNDHAYVLHLWRPQGGMVQMPPLICV